MLDFQILFKKIRKFFLSHLLSTLNSKFRNNFLENVVYIIKFHNQEKDQFKKFFENEDVVFVVVD
jgi:hypothetical protein